MRLRDTIEIIFHAAGASMSLYFFVHRRHFSARLKTSMKQSHNMDYSQHQCLRLVSVLSLWMFAIATFLLVRDLMSGLLPAWSGMP